MVELVWKDKSSPPSFLKEEGEANPQILLTKARYPPSQEEDTASCWHNRLIQGDRGMILPALLPEFAARVNLIYIDPPFMTGKTFNSGTLLAYKDTWHNVDAYLQWLYETLQYLYALLSPTGSLYVHLDWRVVHYAKIMLDEIFSLNPRAGFKNEIIWHYQSGGRTRRHYARKHDTILWYTRSEQYCFHPERIGMPRGPHKRNHMRKEIGRDGRIYWTIRSAGRIYTYDEESLVLPTDVWNDISHLHQKDPQRTGYATQKPEALIERILLASSEEQDLVLDCFCGSGVTPCVAERLCRRWLACDKSETAIATSTQRLLNSTRQQPFIVQYLDETRQTAYNWTAMT
jgi:site-specific DNA-methyltransferase (adenine-specific)